MANAVLLSKFTATQHPATVQSLFLHHRQIHRLPALNLRFTPRLDFSRYSLKITALKLKPKPPKSSSIPQNQNHKADPPSPMISVNAMLKLLKKCGSTLVIMAVLLMSCPNRAWAKVHILSWQASSARRRREAAAAAASSSSSSSSSLPVSISQRAAVLSICIFGACSPFLKAYTNACLDSGSGSGSCRTSVLKLQVGLLDTARSLLRELLLIAEIPCSSTHTTRSRVLTGAILALLCHPEYCISAYTCAHVERSLDEADRRYDLLYEEDRAKLNKGRGHVVTIMVVVKGNHTIPTIKGSIDLNNALGKLESIPPSDIISALVTWTPAAENKTLSEREFESYPLVKL